MKKLNRILSLSAAAALALSLSACGAQGSRWSPALPLPPPVKPIRWP